MSSRGGSSSNNGGGVQTIPPSARKMVQNLKEIVSCPDPEIYAMLKECNMDPNEAVNRLLTQDPFHEVKSKREKKKENKDTTELRSRGTSSSSNRGVRGGSDRYVGRGGSTQFSSSESGSLHGKSAYKKENGSTNYANPSSGTAGNNVYRRPPAYSDSVTTENKASIMGTVDGSWSSSQPPSGHQSVWSDIVKMGRPQGKAPSTTNQSQYGVYPQHVQPGGGAAQHGSPDDEWPLVEPSSAASISPVVEPHVASGWHIDESHLSSNRIDQHPESQQDEVPAIEDASLDSISANHAGYTSVSSGRIQNDTYEGASPFNSDMYETMDSYKPHLNAVERQEVEENGVSVSSVMSNLQQLNVQDDQEVSPEEDDAAVIIPNHLQVQSADCLHLSFGSFGSLNAGPTSSGPFSSRPQQSSMEDGSADIDAPSVGHLDARDSEYYGDEHLRTASDGNLGHRTGASTGVYDSPSASQPEVLKQENPDTPHENQYTFPSSSNYNFENGPQLNAFPHSQTSSQMQNLAPFSNQAYANSLPSSLLATSSQSVRESDYSYSPFSMAQSMPTKYGSTISSVSSSTISMPEALKGAGFSSTLPTAQTLPGSNIATGPALPQHLAVHPYSQPTLPLAPFANMIGYPFLPQSYTYMPSAFQQAFAGNNTYHQSLAGVLPQYKNSVSVSSLPQSAAVASGYGGFGNSTSIPGNFSTNQPSAPGPTTMGYDDVLNSQYKDSSHLLSLQQNENQTMWVQGPGSRTMSAIPASTYYSYQGQAQQPSGFRQNQQPSQNYGALGNSNFYHSQSGILLEHQQQNPRDGPLVGSQVQAKQSQQLWQNSY